MASGRQGVKRIMNAQDMVFVRMLAATAAYAASVSVTIGTAVIAVAALFQSVL
jgi:hypothetical protein